MLTSSAFSSLLRILSKSIHCRLVVVQAKKAIPANLAKVLKDKLLCIILTTTASQILIPKRKKHKSGISGKKQFIFMIMF